MGPGPCHSSTHIDCLIYNSQACSVTEQLLMIMSGHQDVYTLEAYSALEKWQANATHSNVREEGALTSYIDPKIIGPALGPRKRLMAVLLLVATVLSIRYGSKAMNIMALLATGLEMRSNFSDALTVF